MKHAGFHIAGRLSGVGRIKSRWLFDGMYNENEIFHFIGCAVFDLVPQPLQDIGFFQFGKLSSLNFDAVL